MTKTVVLEFLYEHYVFHYKSTPARKKNAIMRNWIRSKAAASNCSETAV